LQNDANRRDLTINALYYDPVKREIIDPVGGAKDLKDKRIKAVGVPEQRFEEDQVRKMRAVRFFVSMGGTWDPNTYDALKANPDISKVSKIGIFNELEKGIQKTKNVIEYLTLLDNLGFLTQIFPNLAITKPFINEKDITILIAYLLKNNPEKTLETALKQELKYSRDLTRDIVFLVSLTNFDVQKIVQYKKTQSIVDLKPSQIQRFGQHIGVNFTRFLKFKLSVKNPEELKLKGEDIKKWILQKEIENYNSINEIAASIFSKINNYFILR
jgi:tRNA nucleotidyltransferase/poly(A) polymerase